MRTRADVVRQELLTGQRSLGARVGAAGPAGQGFTWRGEWNSGTAYAAYDVVHYDGSAYVALEATTNEAPGTVSPDPWDLFASEGAAGGSTLDGAHVTLASDATAQNYTTAAAIPWDSEVRDSAAFWSGGNPTRLTAPATGVYNFGANLGLALVGSGNRTLIQLRIDGTTVVGGDESDPAAASRFLSASVGQYPLTSGQFVEAWLQVTTDTSVTITAGQSNLWMERVG